MRAVRRGTARRIATPRRRERSSVRRSLWTGWRIGVVELECRMASRGREVVVPGGVAVDAVPAGDHRADQRNAHDRSEARFEDDGRLRGSTSVAVTVRVRRPWRIVAVPAARRLCTQLTSPNAENRYSRSSDLQDRDRERPRLAGLAAADRQQDVGPHREAEAQRSKDQRIGPQDEPGSGRRTWRGFRCGHTVLQFRAAGSRSSH